MFADAVRCGMNLVQPYLVHIPGIVGSYRYGYGAVEMVVYSSFKPGSTTQKVKALYKKFFVTPGDHFRVHGSMVVLSGACQLGYWAQNTGLIKKLFTDGTLWNGASWLFLAAHITSLIYFTHLCFVAHELAPRDAELAQKLRAQAIWGIAAALTAIIATAAVMLSPGALAAYILGGIAALTGFVKVLTDWKTI